MQKNTYMLALLLGLLSAVACSTERYGEKVYTNGDWWTVGHPDSTIPEGSKVLRFKLAHEVYYIPPKKPSEACGCGGSYPYQLQQSKLSEWERDSAAIQNRIRELSNDPNFEGKAWFFTPWKDTIIVTGQKYDPSKWPNEDSLRLANKIALQRLKDQERRQDSMLLEYQREIQERKERIANQPPPHEQKYFNLVNSKIPHNEKTISNWSEAKTQGKIFVKKLTDGSIRIQVGPVNDNYNGYGYYVAILSRFEPPKLSKRYRCENGEEYISSRPWGRPTDPNFEKVVQMIR